MEGKWIWFEITFFGLSKTWCSKELASGCVDASEEVWESGFPQDRFCTWRSSSAGDSVVDTLYCSTSASFQTPGPPLRAAFSLVFSFSILMKPQMLLESSLCHKAFPSHPKCCLPLLIFLFRGFIFSDQFQVCNRTERQVQGCPTYSLLALRHGLPHYQLPSPEWYFFFFKSRMDLYWHIIITQSP